GIDIGTYSSKGVLVTTDGKVIQKSSIPHKVSIPNPGWMEHDPDGVWMHDFIYIVKDLLHKSGKDPEEIISLGVSSIASATLLLDKDRNPVRPSILYGVDTRTTAEVEEIKKDLGIFVSNQNIPPKLRWVQKNEPQVWKRTRYIMSGHHYIIMRLTGEFNQNINDMGNYTPLFDDEKLDWNPKYFKYFDITADMLPKPVWSHEIVGRITSEGAALSGLAEGTPVVGGCNDSAVEAISGGVVLPGDMMMMYGSSNIYFLVTDGPIQDKKLSARRSITKDRYGVGGGLATVGSLTTWFRNNLGYPEMEAEKKGGENAFAALAKLSTQSKIGSNGLIALPYFSGERTPIFDGNACGLYFGLNLTHTRADMYRALLESVGYGIRHCMEDFWERNLIPKHIYAVGGGVYNLPWMQIVSDINNFTQEIPVIKIGSCYGDAFLAAMGIGLYNKVSDVKKWVKIETVVRPDLEAHKAYEEYYRIYRELYPANKELMHQIVAIQKRG
ncbi:MAG: FGGY-family carbohydrate kinase, partial [Anaerolineaceae bacterium]|nr:FGGY-family carbohydrate kinase [Anaerolineaceae bacterium]